MNQIRPSQRLDAQRRQIVDHGIALQKHAGTVSAVEFLRSRNIAGSIIARVLGEPAQRRPPAT